MIQILFFILFFLIFYCYFGYPILVLIFSLIFNQQVEKSSIEPSVSIIISVYNEEDFIEEKIKNLLALDYPLSKVEIIIGSDGSTDYTNEIVSRYQSSHLIFYPFNQRRGKMAVLNDLVATASHEVLVFTDARQIFECNALRELVANFSDRYVGCVSGELCFKPFGDAGATAQGINLYWNYEKFLRSCESRIHSMLGATGAIYAIRRELFTPIPENLVLDDMFVPLQIVRRGFRAVFDQRAYAYDTIANNPQEEHRRKVRTLYGNYQILLTCRSLFNPLTSPIAIQLFSHKFLRIICPFLLISLFFVNLYLSYQSSFYRLFLLGQVIFYGLALLGAWLKSRKQYHLKFAAKICYIPYVFCLLNFSALVGFLRFIRHQQTVTWEKARQNQI